MMVVVVVLVLAVVMAVHWLYTDCAMHAPCTATPAAVPAAMEDTFKRSVRQCLMLVFRRIVGLTRRAAEDLTGVVLTVRIQHLLKGMGAVSCALVFGRRDIGVGPFCRLTLFSKERLRPPGLYTISLFDVGPQNLSWLITAWLVSLQDSDFGDCDGSLPDQDSPWANDPLALGGAFSATCCNMCSATLAASGRLQACPVCKVAFYCSRACRKMHWYMHYHICHEVADAYGMEIEL